jgi:restriction system protein
MAHPEGVPAKDALQALQKKLSLTAYEAGYYETSGTRRFEKLVRFATVDCAKAGWMLKQKGTWYVTKEGTEAYYKYSNPGDLYREATRLYRVWKLGQEPAFSFEDTANSDVDSDKDKTVQEKASVTFEEAEEQAWREIEKYLLNFNPYDFQQLVTDLIEAMGYHVSWISPPGKDGGLDIIANVDPLGLQPPRIKIQVKRNSNRINVDDVRAFGALINENDAGLFVAAGGFTKDAEEFARNQERRKITLIDSERFVDLWIENYERLADSARQSLPLQPIFFLALDN